MNNMIVIANRSETKFYRVNTETHKLQRINTMENKYVKLREKDLRSDSPGKTVKDFTSGPRKLTKEHSALKHTLKVYSHNIVDYLKKEKDLKKYQSLILVAAPKMLGHICSELDKRKLKAEEKIDKDLNYIDDEKLFYKIHENISNITLI